MRSPTGAALLAKGLACARCKTRKTRCDGGKPACGACLRSARFKHRPLDEVVCHYGDPLDDTKSQVTPSPKNVPSSKREDRTSSSESSTLSVVSTASSGSSYTSTSSSFASSSTSFQSFSSLGSDCDTDASSVHTRTIDAAKNPFPPPLHHPYATYLNPASQSSISAPSSSLIASSTDPTLPTPKLDTLMKPGTRRSPASQAFPFAGASSSHATKTISGRRRNAPCSIPIPMEARFDPAIPHSAPPRFDRSEHGVAVPSFPVADLGTYASGPDQISMGSFVALPEVAPPVEQPTLVLPPPLHNYNSYQGDQFQEESIRQISTYTAVHRHNYGPRTPALPTYELVPGGQLDGIVPCETSGKMVPEPLVATTTAATFDSNQLQWPLPDGRTGLTPVGTIPTGCSPWPTW